MRCSNCGSENPADKKFCGDCGAPLANRCPNCSSENPAGKRFCGECGSPLIGNAQPGVAQSSRAESSAPDIRLAPDQTDTSLVIEGERKTVTALFADIKGSMELMEDLDPEEARAIVDPALKVMIDAVHRYGGYIVQSTGDGIFALFGAPVAHEDHPQRALYAALRMQEEMRRYGDRMRAQGQTPIQVRIGVNTGEVVVRSIQTSAGHTEYTPIGHSTSLAARLQTLATPGSTVISGYTRGFVEGYFQLKALGPTRVKGVSEPVEVFEVTGLGPLRTRLQRAAGRGLTKFVGREREMEAIRHAAGLAKEGHGQLVAAMAEPGIGKSRLFYEFKVTSGGGAKRASMTGGDACPTKWMVLETFSISHGKASAYLPVVDLLRNYFDISSNDDERRRREKAAGKIVMLDHALEDTIPYVFALLGLGEGGDPAAQMDAQIRKRRTLEAIKRIILRESLNQPVMVIFEDLHWIDEQTQEFLNVLADSIGTAKILLLVNYRPEYRHGWGSKTYYTQLRLDPLGKENAEEMLTSLLGQGAELSALKRLIIERTEGNPFFMEEIVQALFEEGALVRGDPHPGPLPGGEGNKGREQHIGRIRLTRALSGIRIPATVQAMLAARIDRLAQEDKDLLQTVAVLGKEFTLSQLRATITNSESELEQRLADLQSAEFIYEQPAAGDIEYTFKHALTQEVAYNSVLIERRKQIHQRAAQAIKSLFGANLPDRYNELAHHYRRSGNAPEAVKYLRLAAEQAISRSAYAEAGDQLTSALELLAAQADDLDRDRSELSVRFNLAVCVTRAVSGGVTASGTVNNLERARELCLKLGDHATLLQVLAALGSVYGNRFERQKAQAVGAELLDMATRVDDSDMVGRARWGLGFLLLLEGKLLAATHQLDHAFNLLKGSSSEMGLGNWRSVGLIASLNLWLLGYPERAVAMRKESFAVARGETESLLYFAPLHFWSCILDLTLRDPSAALSHIEEAGRLAREHGLLAMVTPFEFVRDWTIVHLGQAEQGLADMVRRYDELMKTGIGVNAMGVPFFSRALAEAHLVAGHANEGLKAVGEGLEFMGRTGVRMFEPEMRRLKGELLLMRDDGAEQAIQCFGDAIELARSQSAKSLELRATMSLARLLAKHSRRDEARSALADIYNWFTEGFDTADLKDAKALLDQLSDLAGKSES